MKGIEVKQAVFFQGNGCKKRKIKANKNKLGWINNPEQWIEFLEARNKASHIYHEEVANELFKIIPLFLKASHELLNVLEEKLK